MNARVDNQIRFRADEDLQKELQARGTDRGMGTTARRDLLRYYSFIGRSVPKFEEDEAYLLVSALRNQSVEPSFVHLLWAVVDDAFRNQKKLADGREESAQRIVARLRDLSPFESLAVLDAAERFWHLVNYRDEVDGQALEQVGLIDEWSVARESREADMARATAARPAHPGDHAA